uniref:DUF4774 domain-containing protein n=1 Tax=Macrostomum lignano TaxID=282301 RepID=A0A1I8HP24_9PLAT
MHPNYPPYTGSGPQQPPPIGLEGMQQPQQQPGYGYGAPPQPGYGATQPGYGARLRLAMAPLNQATARLRLAMAPLNQATARLKLATALLNQATARLRLATALLNQATEPRLRLAMVPLNQVTALHHSLAMAPRLSSLATAPHLSSLVMAPHNINKLVMAPHTINKLVMAPHTINKLTGYGAPQSGYGASAQRGVSTQPQRMTGPFDFRTWGSTGFNQAGHRMSNYNPGYPLTSTENERRLNC